MTYISYQVGLLQSCQAELVHVYQQTQSNWEASKQAVARNAENFGGQGSEAFQDVIAVVNARYSKAIEQLNHAGVALDHAIGNMQQGDSILAAQYI